MLINRNNLTVLLATGIVVAAMVAGPLVAIASIAAAQPAVAVPATSIRPPASDGSGAPAVELVARVEGSAP